MTKKEKLYILNRICEIATNRLREEDYSFGICFLIYEVDSDLYLSDFPEILRYKPDEYYDFFYWFERNRKGAEKRIAIIKAAIEEVTNG